MLILAIAMQMTMTMAMPATKTKGNPTPQAMHHSQITVDELAAATIAYCERSRQTMCVNGVSSLSGGATVTVCKISGKWEVNRCVPKRRR